MIDRGCQHSALLRRCERSTRGFTLIELMVAMVGGLFVAMGVFALAKYSSSFSMRQARVSDATMQAVVGFERLRADISRAGFLGTPNFSQDPSFCGNESDPNIPDGIADLAAIRIEDLPPAQLSTEMTVNGIAPRRITLAGSFSAIDDFEVSQVQNGTPVTVNLSPNSVGMANIGYPADPTLATLTRVFRTGRILRLVDTNGRTHFGEITGATAGATPSITLGTFPQIPFQGGGGVKGCTLEAHGTGAMASVINQIRYDLVDLSGDASFAGMFGGGPTYESGRRELIREEIDIEGSAYDGSRELIAEYAVDLNFSLFVEDAIAGPLTRVSGSDVLDWAGVSTSLGAGKGPQLIRALHAWLSVRSREADRQSALSLPTTAPGPDLLRISLHPNDASQGPYVRVRTLQSTVPLHNQRNSTWVN